MAQTVSILLPAQDPARLAVAIGDRTRPQKHIQRARIIVLSADRLPVVGVARQAGVSRPTVWRWQQRFAEEGVEGLLRNKTRKPGKPPLSAETIAKIVALPCGEPPGEATHWLGRMVTDTVGVSLRAVQRIWQAHRIQPHRIRTFKKSNDRAFAEVEDIVGLYMNPPAHAVVVFIDECPQGTRSVKTQVQALDRTHPGLPLKPGKCGTMTHNYKRNGTTPSLPSSTSSTAPSSDAACRSIPKRNSSSGWEVPFGPLNVSPHEAASNGWTVFLANRERTS